MTSRQGAIEAQVGMLPGQPDRRRGHRIAPSFQNRFRSMLLSVSLSTLVVVGLLALGLGWGVEHPGALPRSPWVPVALFAVGPALVLAVFRVSDRISHRYCGPIRRISNTLEAVQRGERPAPIRLRRGDEFQELAETVNATLRTLGAMDR